MKITINDKIFHLLFFKEDYDQIFKQETLGNLINFLKNKLALLNIEIYTEIRSLKIGAQELELNNDLNSPTPALQASLFPLNQLPAELLNEIIIKLSQESVLKLWATGNRRIQKVTDSKHMAKLIFDSNFHSNKSLLL